MGSHSERSYRASVTKTIRHPSYKLIKQITTLEYCMYPFRNRFIPISLLILLIIVSQNISCQPIAITTPEIQAPATMHDDFLVKFIKKVDSEYLQYKDNQVLIYPDFENDASILRIIGALNVVNGIICLCIGSTLNIKEERQILSIAGGTISLLGLLCFFGGLITAKKDPTNCSPVIILNKSNIIINDETSIAWKNIASIQQETTYINNTVVDVKTHFLDKFGEQLGTVSDRYDHLPIGQRKFRALINHFIAQ